MRLCLYGDKAKHMDFYQRAYSAWYLYQNLSATLKTLEIVKCAFLMLGAWPHVVFADMGQLKTMIRIAATGQLFSFIHRLLESGVQGYTQSAAYVCSYFYLNACRQRLLSHPTDRVLFADRGLQISPLII